MNTTQSYTYNGINYQYSRNARKWIFESPNFELIQPCFGGSHVAHKVVKLLDGALKRTGGKGLDNLGRFHIKAVSGY